jgi:hypothetical protein
MSTTPTPAFLAAEQEINARIAARRKPLSINRESDKTSVLSLACNGRVVLSGDAAARETRLFSASH